VAGAIRRATTSLAAAQTRSVVKPQPSGNYLTPGSRRSNNSFAARHWRAMIRSIVNKQQLPGKPLLPPSSESMRRADCVYASDSHTGCTSSARSLFGD
jgi:hypothetical protein